MSSCRVRGCPLCYAGRRGRKYYRGHYGHVKSSTSRKERLVVSRHRGPVRDGPPNEIEKFPLTEWSKKHGHIWEFIAAGSYDDGSSRVPGTVLLCVGEGRVRLWLHDRDQELSAWISAGSVEE